MEIYTQVPIHINTQILLIFLHHLYLKKKLDDQNIILS